MTVWVDGDNYLGRIKEFEEPKLAIVTEDVRNGGMLGVVPVDRGLDKLTATLTAAGLEDALTSYFGITDIGGVPCAWSAPIRATTATNPIPSKSTATVVGPRSTMARQPPRATRNTNIPARWCTTAASSTASHLSKSTCSTVSSRSAASIATPKSWTS
jgi:hypothetical protein